MRKFFKQFSFPGRHRQPLHPGDAGFHPRGRRTGLQPLPRLRRGLRQSRPDRGRGGRRRRGRDRSAGHLLAFQQVPEPASATGPCCPSFTSTATRSPTPRCSRASPRSNWKASLSAMATSRTSSRAPIPKPCTNRWPQTLERAVADIKQIQQEARATGVANLPAVAHDRAAHPQGLDRAQGGGRA